MSKNTYRTTDPKYNIKIDQTGTPVMINAASGEEITEPMFIMRAKDKNAVDGMLKYAELCRNEEHIVAVVARIVEFIEWRGLNEHCVKEPDTDISEPNQGN